MITAMESLALSAKKKNDSQFYSETADAIHNMSTETFAFKQKEFMDSYAMRCLTFAVPHVKREQVSLDSRLMSIERSTSTTFPYVIRITNPFKKNARLTVPLMTSGNSLRRINQYGIAGTVHYTVWNNGRIRVQVSFTKRIHKPKVSGYVGVDTGMKDCFYVSDGRSVGTMNNVIQYYENIVEPAFGELSSLRNKKKKICHYLRSHPDVPDDVRENLLAKVDRLEWMIRTADAPYHKKRHYYDMLNHEVSSSVKAYINGTDKDTVTVLERLDIKEFNKSRKLNGELSVLARGLLQKKLMAELNWHGMAFVEVEPDYSSQTCPVCGKIDAASRNGKKFCCTQCGHTDDADHNAAVNLMNRATDQEFLDVCEKYKYKHSERQKAIFAIGKCRAEAWKNAHPDEILKPAV